MAFSLGLGSSRRASARRPRRRRPVAALAAVLGLGLAVAPIVAAPPAAAEGRGVLGITKQIVGMDDPAAINPGERFVYTIVVTCDNIGTSGGCTNAVLTDPLPNYLSVTGPVSITGTPGTSSVTGRDVKVVFTAPLTDPPGSVGLPDGSSVTIQIPVELDADIPATENGKSS